MINDLSSVHVDVERDTQWLALCLSGSSAPPPGSIVDIVTESTPWRRILKECLILKVDTLPGAACSSKGKKTKMSYFWTTPALLFSSRWSLPPSTSSW